MGRPPCDAGIVESTRRSYRRRFLDRFATLRALAATHPRRPGAEGHGVHVSNDCPVRTRSRQSFAIRHGVAPARARSLVVMTTAPRAYVRAVGPPYYTLLTAIHRADETAPRHFAKSCRASGLQFARHTRWRTGLNWRWAESTSDSARWCAGDAHGRAVRRSGGHPSDSGYRRGRRCQCGRARHRAGTGRRFRDAPAYLGEYRPISLPWSTNSSAVSARPDWTATSLPRRRRQR